MFFFILKFQWCFILFKFLVHVLLILLMYFIQREKAFLIVTLLNASTFMYYFEQESCFNGSFIFKECQSNNWVL